MGAGNRDRIDTASPHDVRFLLNSCGLGDQGLERVVPSRVSARSFTGDHLDAYTLKITPINPAGLAVRSAGPELRWYRGDQLPPVLADAVTWAASCLSKQRLLWLPREKELRSPDFFVYPVSIYLHGLSPTAAQLIFSRPASGMFFYFSGKA